MKLTPWGAVFISLFYALIIGGLVVLHVHMYYGDNSVQQNKKKETFEHYYQLKITHSGYTIYTQDKDSIYYIPYGKDVFLDSLKDRAYFDY